MADERPNTNDEGRFWLDENSNVSEDDQGNFSQDDDVRDGARPILRLGPDGGIATGLGSGSTTENDLEDDTGESEAPPQDA